MKYKLLVIASVFVVLLVVAGAYFSSKGNVYIDLTNVADGTELTLTIHNNGDDSSTKIVKNKSSVLLGSGTYAISLRNQNNSLVRVVAVPSFFGTTTISDSLVNEQQRTFIGTNPSPCVLYVATVFYSASCGDSTDALQQQASPTLSSAGYTTKASTEMIGTIITTSATNNASYALLENYADDEIIRHLVQVGSNLSSTKKIAIPSGIDGDIEMVTSSTKVLVYSKAALLGYVYDENTGSLEKITLPNTEDNYEMLDVSLSNSHIVTTYSESEASDGVDEGALVTGASKIFVQEFTSKGVEYSVSKLYSQATYCASNTLCAVGPEGLDIYKIESGSLSKATSFPGVTDVLTFGDNTRFIDSTGIKTFDIGTRKGYYEYTFGDYKNCGIAKSVSGYVVCVIDTKNQKHAVFISALNKSGTDTVDKKVLDLLKSNVVSGVSVVNNFVYVIPNYGDVGIFTQDRETTIRINQNIDSVIRNSSISKQEYFVINAGDPL